MRTTGQGLHYCAACGFDCSKPDVDGHARQVCPALDDDFCRPKLRVPKVLPKCPLGKGKCPLHHFAHGREAEELRRGIERLLAKGPPRRVTWAHALQALLDRVDARDSLAYLEGSRVRAPRAKP